VAGRRPPGKRFYFAKNQAHCGFHRRAFRRQLSAFSGASSPELSPFKVEYAQSLIDNFSIQGQSAAPRAFGGLLDTGIDVPRWSIWLLFKVVPLEDQILADARARYPAVSGSVCPGKHKQYFQIFDYCGKSGVFRREPATVDGGGR